MRQVHSRNTLDKFTRENNAFLTRTYITAGTDKPSYRKRCVHSRASKKTRMCPFVWVCLWPRSRAVMTSESTPVCSIISRVALLFSLFAPLPSISFFFLLLCSPFHPKIAKIRSFYRDSSNFHNPLPLGLCSVCVTGTVF